ncbi:hypothetical protein [Halomicrococcus sp. SG-WS-1]|uniref:hypothetical protein n=1 Tax=Halomicrococcus sp. SG-WS-1 TaxID=3439057 RepID=UPI003F7A88AE
MPSRRSLLATCGSAAAVALAGCLSSGSTRGGTTTGDATGTTATSTTEPPTTDASSPEVREVDPTDLDRGVPLALPDVGVSLDGPPARAFAVGTDDPDADPKPHPVWVWNATDAMLTVELHLAMGSTSGSETTLLAESVTLDPGSAVAVALRERRHYYRLTTLVGNREEDVTVRHSDVDCNDSATDVAVTSEKIRTSSVTTDAACGTSTVA